METRRLPVEVITYILSFLPIADRKEASLVNHTWYFAAQDSLRQENILYNIPATSASLAAIESLARRRVSCVSLTSLDSSTVSRDVIQAVSCHLGPHLQSLCLRGSSLPETAFVHLLLACPCLSALDLTGCNSLFMSGTLLSKPETISQARGALTNLQDLNLAGLRYLSDLSFNRLTGCAPHLARLSLARCHLTFEFDPYRGSSNYNSSALLSFRNLLRFLKERASSLRALDLSGTSITSPAMRSLVQVEGLRLRELVLQNCRDLSNEAIGLLCTHQPHLTVLDLTGCSELSDRAALTVSAGLRALRSLGLGKLQRLTDGGFLGIAELRSLQRLDLSECSLVSGSELVKVCSTPELRPSLASLSFAFCSLLRVSAPIPAIGRRGRALPFGPIPLHLQLGRQALPHRGSLLHRALFGIAQCSSLASHSFPSPPQDSSVLSLARSLSPSLRVLDLSSCVSITNVSIQAISSHLPRLTVLRLAWCKELTDWGLLDVEEPREERHHRREKDAGPQFSRNFGNMGFFLPPLQNLEQDPKVLSDSAWNESQKRHRASLQALKQLQELDLMACSKLTDSSITKVIRFPALRRLSLGLLPEITDASLVAVARGCQSLEQLSMSHCGKLTDKGFLEAASSLRRLQHLVISGCSQLTRQTLMALSRECRQLKSLDVSMCHGISMADIELFQAQLPLQTCVQSRFVGGADLSFTL
ncbi:F-box/LRR-repeat protein 2 isoform X2 [Chrysemys picta bellii]|uniref:F-box/LRR-repeat protein 2 isoform X2 n=1 Tax=Chrysemys picta bellii TaxID=8478 RepID=UPI0032B1F11F